MSTPPNDIARMPVRCLLVDDREENLIALEALLRSDQVEVLTASSGAQALDLLLKHDIALVLLDVQMPELDGFEVAELMRGSERTRHIPIIFVTAGAHDAGRTFRGYESGAVDFLHKPVDGHILRNKAETFFELHRRERKIAQQLEERGQLLRINEIFMGVLGHDLRSPLGAIRLSAQLLQNLHEDTRTREIAARIVSSSDHMRDMIEDLLDVTRVRLGGGIPVDPRPADLGKIVEHAVGEQRLLYPERTVEVHAQGDLAGHWDANRLEQLTTNLVGNALKHGDPSAPVRVRVDGSETQGVRLSVHNAGLIPADRRDGLFDPFQRKPASGDRHQGLGLGLYIAQQIARAHHATILMHSEAGQGTLATVVFPR
jgi:two-component system, sensor histidine kinase and response regulator